MAHPPHTQAQPTMQGMVDGLMKSLLRQAASMTFHKCGVAKCPAHSLGFVCSECSRFACQGHVYFRASVPPVAVCACCITDATTEETKK